MSEKKVSCSTRHLYSVCDISVSEMMVSLTHARTQDEDQDEFVLVEVSPSTSYVPVELDPHEMPWSRLKELKQVSLSHFVNIRYILRRKEKEKWTTLFISGLPADLLHDSKSAQKVFDDLVMEGMYLDTVHV